MVLATFLLLLMTELKSLLTSFTVKPYSFEFFRYSNTCADFNKALVGIQPQFKQTPPKFSFSTIAVDKPS